jgi:chemotaxis protein CheD
MKEKDVVIIGVGGMHADNAPVKIVTYLGSCIAVCLYAPARRVGGMVHVVMAALPPGGDPAKVKKGKYADTAVPALLERLKGAYRLDEKEFVVKIFGGAKILRTVNVDIGRVNERAVRDALDRLGLKVAASRTGGEKGYRVEFNLENGNVTCRLFGEEPREY